MICPREKRGKERGVYAKHNDSYTQSCARCGRSLGSCWGMEAKWHVQENSKERVTAGNRIKQDVG